MRRILRVLVLPGMAALTLLTASVLPAQARTASPQPSVSAMAFRHPAVAIEKARATIPAAIYTVRPGDTLSAISARYLGGAGNWPRLYGANVKVVGPDPNMIIPGQQLTLVLGPAQTGSVPSDPPPAQAATDPDGDSDGDGVGSSAQAPAQQAQPAQQQAQQSSSSGSWPGGSFGNCVVQRESGGNAQVMNSTGHYGLYQFSASTWAAYGGNPGDWGHASVAEQEQVFMNAMAQGGQGNWAPYDGC